MVGVGSDAIGGIMLIPPRNGSKEESFLHCVCAILALQGATVAGNQAKTQRLPHWAPVEACAACSSALLDKYLAMFMDYFPGISYSAFWAARACLRLSYLSKLK